MLFPEPLEMFNIFRSYDMPFFEGTTFEFVFADLGYVMSQYHTHGL
jgi:hypothetical protein